MSVYLGNNLLAGTGSEVVSNAHSLLDYKWTDHILNEMCWLRADTFSWQSGKVYKAVYEHLLADMASATMHSESVGGVTITYYVAPDKHKIVSAAEVAKVGNLFNLLDCAWWYVLDTINKRFKLPRCAHGEIVDRYVDGVNWYRLYEDGWIEQGGGFGAAYTSYTTKTITFLQEFRDLNYNVQIEPAYNGNMYIPSLNALTRTSFTAVNTMNLSEYARWYASGYVTKGTPSAAPYTYLYFYVGDYSQSAIEQTAGITAEQLNDKLDADKIQFVSALPSVLDENVIYLISDVT